MSRRTDRNNVHVVITIFRYKNSKKKKSRQKKVFTLSFQKLQVHFFFYSFLYILITHENILYFLSLFSLFSCFSFPA